MAETYLGLDFGGTKLLIGELDLSGEVLFTKRYTSGYMGQEEALAFITNSLDDYFKEGRPVPKAMGLGLLGRVNSREGIWFELDKQRGGSTPLCEILLKRYGIPCFIDNDVKSAARAELRFGRGKQSKHFIYLNIGTGIAAGCVSGGQLIRGNSFNAGEVGHTSAGLTLGIPCSCGRSDCVETIASGAGLNACARRFALRFPDTVLAFPEDGPISAREIFALSDRDALCGFLTENAARGAANLIMNLVRVTDPDMVVLGGGTVSDGFLLSRIEKHVNAHTMRFVSGGVVLTGLNPAYAGLIGAGTVAMEGFENA